MSAEQIHAIELENQRETLQMQYRQRLRLLQLKRAGAQIVYTNQAVAAAEILRQFIELKKVWVVLVAPPGAGKTGVILEVLRQLGQHSDDKNQIHIKNMLVITGMSDNDWTKTMKEGMLPALHDTVHHRGEFRTMDTAETMRDGIIVTDECHVACQVNQTLDKKLRSAGLKDIDALRSRNMRMLDVSATPEGVLYDLSRWREHAAVVVLQPDEKYKGFQSMLDEERLRSAKDFDLDKMEDAEKLLKLFDDRYKDSPTKKYFAFRLGQSYLARQNIREACKKLGWADPENHDSTERVEDIDAQMEKAPLRHKVFFVKGFWRASKRLVRQHVGGTYETPTSRPDDTSKSQGLTARFCNTFDWEGEQTDVNLRPLHFDDLDSINRYLAWWDAGVDYTQAAYSAPRMRANGDGAVTAPKSKVHPASVAGVEAVEEDPAPAPVPVASPTRQRAAHQGPRANRTGYFRDHKEFPTAEAARAFYVARFGSDAGYASNLHKHSSGKFKCSFSTVDSGVHTVDVVRSHLATGNLWGANQKKLDGTAPLSQIGTLKVGYTGDVPTFFLCVQSKTEFKLVPATV
jgi:hypothetical protein